MVCESDSKSALILIEQGVDATHVYVPIVYCIKSLTHNSRDLVFAHSPIINTPFISEYMLRSVCSYPKKKLYKKKYSYIKSSTFSVSQYKWNVSYHN